MSDYIHDIVGTDDTFINYLFNRDNLKQLKVDTRTISRQIIDDLFDSFNDNAIFKASLSVILRELLHVKWLNENLSCENEKIQNDLMVSKL